MDKVQLEISGLSSSHAQNGSFALVMGETKGKRRLPIIIGMFEAQAIAIELENIVSPRPMTHDLFKAFSEKFNFNVTSIVISDLKEGVFYAKINCTDDHTSRSIEIDSRPSDAIAIALRFQAPIYASERVMSEAGIVISNEEDEDEDSPGAIVPATPSGKEKEEEQPAKIRPLNEISTDDLKLLMESAINSEDYEQAAKIRDEISKRTDGKA